MFASVTKSCRIFVAGYLGLFAIAAPLFAQEKPGTVAANSSQRRSGDRAPSAIPSILDSTTEIQDIEIDGILNEADWENARVFTGFTQREPVEGVPAENDTEVRVLFGEDAIWIAARMWDSNPDQIDRRMTRRDNMGTYDQFSVHLDPNLDSAVSDPVRGV
jgi:hypothetical protein